MKSKFLFLLIIQVLSLFFTQSVFADTPVVKTFTASASSIISGQPVGFTWMIENGKATISIPCLSGVSLMKPDGTPFTCGSAQTVNDESSDALSLLVYNFSGSTRTLVATILPKDISGTTYPSLSRSISVGVQTDPEPIWSFSSSATTTNNKVQSFAPVTLSWSFNKIANVNIVMSCDNKIVATSSSYLSGQNIICGSLLFSVDKTGSESNGTFTFSAYNKGDTDSDLTLTMMPVTDKVFYDASHGKTLKITLAPYKPLMPIVTTFSIPGNRVTSNATTTLSWGVINTNSIKIKSYCDDLAITSLVGATTTKSTCGNFLFSNDLSATGTSSISFVSQLQMIKPVTLILIPQRPDGVFDTAYSKSINIIVDPKGSAVQGGVGGMSPILPIPISNNPTSPIKSVAKFTKSLSFGSRDAEVTILQQFLKKYPDLYPEGSVTGYFGPASVRAIKRFQEKYKIAKLGDVGYGSVGPKTRAKLNELQ